MKAARVVLKKSANHCVLLISKSRQPRQESIVVMLSSACASSYLPNFSVHLCDWSFQIVSQCVPRTHKEVKDLARNTNLCMGIIEKSQSNLKHVNTLMYKQDILWIFISLWQSNLIAEDFFAHCCCIACLTRTHESCQDKGLQLPRPRLRRYGCCRASPRRIGAASHEWWRSCSLWSLATLYRIAINVYNCTQ